MHFAVESPAPVLVTTRTRIRPLVASDREEHFALFRDPETVRYLYDEPLTKDRIDEHLARRIRTTLPGEGEWISCAVEGRNDGKYLGEVAFTLVSATHGYVEVGYVFTQHGRGHGLATEAAGAIVDFAFAHYDAHRVGARLDARNDRSARVLERLGFRREAHFRENEFVKGEWCDELAYAVLATEWRTRLANGHEWIIRDAALEAGGTHGA